LEGEFSLLSRDLIEAKKESLQGMPETRSILPTGMLNFLMGLRLESIRGVSSSCHWSRHLKRHNRSSILPTVTDIANRTRMSRRVSKSLVIVSAMATTACVYHGFNSTLFETDDPLIRIDAPLHSFECTKLITIKWPSCR